MADCQDAWRYCTVLPITFHHIRAIHAPLAVLRVSVLCHVHRCLPPHDPECADSVGRDADFTAALPLLTLLADSGVRAAYCLLRVSGSGRFTAASDSPTRLSTAIAMPCPPTLVDGANPARLQAFFTAKWHYIAPLRKIGYASK